MSVENVVYPRNVPFDDLYSYDLFLVDVLLSIVVDVLQLQMVPIQFHCSNYSMLMMIMIMNRIHHYSMMYYAILGEIFHHSKSK